MKVFGVVRRIKNFHHIRVLNAMNMVGWHWPHPRHPPTNIDRMLMGIPTPDLEAILQILEKK